MISYTLNNKLYEFGMTAIFEIILPVCDHETDKLKYINNEKLAKGGFSPLLPNIFLHPNSPP